MVPSGTRTTFSRQLTVCTYSSGIRKHSCLTYFLRFFRFRKKKLISASSLSVYLGHSRIVHIDHDYLFGVAQLVVHPNYTGISRGNDIALLLLARSINFTQQKRIGCTCNSVTPPSAVLRNRCYVAGWGTVNRFRDDQWSSVLQDVRVPLLDESYCLERLPVNFHLAKDSYVCAGYKDGYYDSW